MITITVTDLKEFIPVPSVFDMEERFSIYVKQANRIDLSEALGLDFYNDVIIALEEVAVDPNYQAFLDGEEYENKEGNTIKYEGLKPIITLFALSRFIENQPVNLTRKSVVNKKNEYSEKVSKADLAKQSMQYRNLANSYLSTMFDYLEIHKEIFPVWAKSCGDRGGIRSKIRISKGTKSANRDGYGDGYNIKYNRFDLR